MSSYYRIVNNKILSTSLNGKLEALKYYVPFQPRIFTRRSVSVLNLKKEAERPSLDDVDRLSRGKASKKKIGSRQVPHRLNAEERTIFELSLKKGFLSVRNNSRKYPLINTYRNWCDATGHPNVRIEQSPNGLDDHVIIDVTTLRLPKDEEVNLRLALLELATKMEVTEEEAKPKTVKAEPSEVDNVEIEENQIPVLQFNCNRQEGKKLASDSLKCCLDFMKTAKVSLR